MIRDGQRLALAESISKAEVAPSLANNLIPERSEAEMGATFTFVDL
jgi:hypothetical protein